MAGSRTLSIEIVGNAKGLGAAFNEAGSGAEDMGSKIDGVGSKVTKFGAVAAAGAAAAGVALFAAANEFTNLGIEAGKFSDVTGLAVEDASRWMEVASDLGIETKTLEGAFNKMNIAADKSPEKFAAIGAEIVRTSDGAVDANATFLNVVDSLDGISDPAEKARRASELLGKGWTDMAEMIDVGSAGLTESLGAVSEAKVIDEEELQKAKDMRAGMDSLMDAAQDLMLTLGSALAPVIAKLAPLLGEVIEAAGPLAEAVGEVLVEAIEVLLPVIEALMPVVGALAKALGFVADAIGLIQPSGLLKEFGEMSESFDELEKKALAAGISQEEFQAMTDAAMASVTDATSVSDGLTKAQEALALSVEKATGRLDLASASASLMGERSRSARDGLNEFNIAQDNASAAADRVKNSINNQKAALDALTGALDAEQAFINLQNQFDNVESAATEAFYAAAGGAADAEQKARDARSANIDLKQSVIDYGSSILNLPAKKVTEMLAQIDAGNAAAVERELEIMARSREIRLNVITSGGSLLKGAFASGTPSAPAGLALVGEDGPEIVRFNGGERVYSNAESMRLASQPMPAMTGYGTGTTIVQIQVGGSLIHETDLIQKVSDGIIDAQRRGVIPAGAFG